MSKFQAKTIGNATLVVKNNKSTILVTDPWFDEHPCYFGSWRLTHEIPQEIKDESLKTKYVYISHAHPDHLNLPTLRLFRNKSKVILAEQSSNRLSTEIRKSGFDVIVIPNRKWIELEEGIKILTFSDEKQDSVLLISLSHGDKRSLIVNLNDAGDCGVKREIKNISKQFDNSILLRLASFGCADMINLWDLKSGKEIPTPCDDFSPIGKIYEKSMQDFACNISIPFSSSHQYQREDSWWARKYVASEEDHFKGFKGKENKRLLPIFQSINFKNDENPIFKDIKPKKILINEPVKATYFGDNWNDGFKENDKKEIEEYFQSIDYLKENYDSIGVRFNKDVFYCKLNKKNKFRKNIVFYSPRRSFIYAIRNNVFDDLLIGNFMKTYLGGITNLQVPNFDFYVAKLSDNAYAKTKEDIDKAFAFYNQDRLLEDKYNEKVKTISSFLKNKLISPELRSIIKKQYIKYFN